VASVIRQSPPASLEDLFISIVASSEDLHLESSGHNARNNGVDLSASFTDDIDGETRPTGPNTWDIGADEYMPPLTPLYRSVGITAPALAGDFPTVQATNTSVENAQTTSHTVALPSGIQPGELLIVIFGYKSGTDNTVTWPNGWYQFFQSDRVTNVGARAAYRWADGSEGTTITVTTGLSRDSTHISYRITGAANPPGKHRQRW
jgi:hypothetical protein